MPMRLRAPAKLNLTLDVLGRRPDGFHEIVSVMVPLGLHDVVEIEESPELWVTSDLPGLPDGPENLAYEAATLLRSVTGTDRGARIHLSKRIPVAAGLAGGSTDAAQALVGLNRLWGLGLSQEDLLELAGRLGSDVPFCLLSHPALAKGRGEVLTELSSASPLPVVLAKLDVPKSTGEVYRSLRLQAPEALRSRPNLPLVLQGLKEGNPGTIARGLGNVLETVMFERFPALSALKDALLEAGALGVGMSGSGPTLFALVADDQSGLELGAYTRRLAPWVEVTHLGARAPVVSLPGSAR